MRISIHSFIYTAHRNIQSSQIELFSQITITFAMKCNKIEAVTVTTIWPQCQIIQQNTVSRSALNPANVVFHPAVDIVREKTPWSPNPSDTNHKRTDDRLMLTAAFSLWTACTAQLIQLLAMSTTHLLTVWYKTTHIYRILQRHIFRELSSRAGEAVIYTNTSWNISWCTVASSKSSQTAAVHWCRF